MQNVTNKDLFNYNATGPTHTNNKSQDSTAQILPELSLPNKLANIQASIEQKKHIPPAPDTVMQDIQINEKTEAGTDTTDFQLDKVQQNENNLAEVPGSDSEESDNEEIITEQDPSEQSTTPDTDPEKAPRSKWQDFMKPSVKTSRTIPPPSQMVLRPRKNQTVTFQE